LTRLETSVQRSEIRILLDRGRTIEFHGPADITHETTDAVVNAANSYLLGGGGVDGAIHKAGGPAVLAECRRIVGQIGSLPAGQAVITTGGRLTAKHVIHTVGPVYRDGESGEAEKLASCHRESIRLADQHAIKSLSFPAISTGAFGYPASAAASIAISSTVEALAAASHVSRVRFVLFDVATLRMYTRAAEQLQNLNSVFAYRIEKGSP
jgi:O-acetyl-ADP-ribose deacetylase (regulator of RNase III)